MNNNSKDSKQTPTIVSDDVVKQMVQNEANKIELQKQKLSLQEKNLEKQHDYACKALEAQKEHLKIVPKEKRKDFIAASIFVIITLVLILLFFGFCILNKHIELVMTIVKYIFVAMISFTGGTFYGKSKGHHKKKNDNNHPEFTEAEEIK